MENYIVSARKYRPMTFDSVVGQRALTTTLKNAIAQGKLAHAYLFCGPRGVGKTTCARIFAKTINCMSPTPEGEACNECESCKAFNEQRSFNIHELDAASNNGVEDIRGLIEQVQIPPQIGHYKVFIIDEVHMLSTAAFNAFLKTLEEPPAHAIFVLATTEKHAILPTILSRCQIFDFARITLSDTIKHLEYVASKENIKYEAEALHVIAEKADGGMRDALSIFDQVTSYCEGNITYQKVINDLNVLDYDVYFNMTETLMKSDVPSSMTSLNDILTKGFEGNYFIGGLATHFRNLLMSRDEQTLPLLDVSERVSKRYHEQAMKCDVKLLYRALKLCSNCDMRYNTSRNKRLLVELTLIEIAQAAVGEEDDVGCGRRPTRRLKPIFKNLAANKQLAASVPATSNPVAVKSKTFSAQPQEASAGTVNNSSLTHFTPQPQSTLDVLSAAAKSPAKYHARPAQTMSLRNLQRQLHTSSQQQGTSTASIQQQQAPSLQAVQETKINDQRQQTPFDADRLTYYWFRYAQQLPTEKKALRERMKGMHPVVDVSTWKVSVEVENEMVEGDLRREQIALTSYLRTQLRNDHITLQIDVVTSNSSHHVYSRLEQFKDMLERSPELEMLHKELDLELA